MALVVAATVYARETALSTIGLPGTIGLLVVYVLPLLAIVVFPGRIHGFFLARVD